MGMTTVFNCAGIDKSKFLEYTETNPATYKVSHQFFSSTMGVEFLCGNESKFMQMLLITEKMGCGVNILLDKKKS